MVSTISDWSTEDAGRSAELSLGSSGKLERILWRWIRSWKSNQEMVLFSMQGMIPSRSKGAGFTGCDFGEHIFAAVVLFWMQGMIPSRSKGAGFTRCDFGDSIFETGKLILSE